MTDKEKAQLVAKLERQGILQLLQAELTWKRMLAIWWFIFWRYGLGLFAIFSMVDLVWRVFLGAGVSLSKEAAQEWLILALVISTGLAVVWGVVVIRMALIKHFKLTGVRLLLLPR